MSYMMNYNWHKKFQKNSKVNHNEVYLLGLAERNKRKKELENQKQTEEESRKKELERGFVTYQKDYSDSKSRPLSRVDRPKSTGRSMKSDRSKTPDLREKSPRRSKSNTSRKSRKSWAENLGHNDDLPPFALDNEPPKYSEDFDSSVSSDSCSSGLELDNPFTINSIDSSIQSPRNSATFQIPKMISTSSNKGRKKWKVDDSIPFQHLPPNPRMSRSSSESPIESEIEMEPPSDQLRRLAFDRRQKNWLEESWNLIDTIEKNNKGRQSVLINHEPGIQEDVEMEDLEVQIPLLPRGKTISLYILSTWGDSNYVGLNGVEFWNREGKSVTPEKVCSDGSVEETIDPRSNFYNLIDGNNNTQDDIHCWLSEVKPEMTPKLDFHFINYETLALIRIWNFNRNRVHANRGVKNIVIEIDKKPCFSGEIAMASGTIDSGLPWGDNILFTKDDIILEKIAKNDSTYQC